MAEGLAAQPQAHGWAMKDVPGSTTSAKRPKTVVPKGRRNSALLRMAQDEPARKRIPFVPECALPILRFLHEFECFNNMLACMGCGPAHRQQRALTDEESPRNDIQKQHSKVAGMLVGQASELVGSRQGGIPRDAWEQDRSGVFFPEGGRFRTWSHLASF